MREIKVRGYSTEEMVFSQWLYGIGVSEVKFSEDYAKQIGRPSNWHLMTESGWARVHEESIGQYTGLKDKNGTEIFEGDILEIEPENKEHYPQNSMFFVKSYRTLWGYEFTWEHISGYDCSTHIAEIDDEYKQLINVEVIGNIYENPELLEVD